MKIYIYHTHEIIVHLKVIETIPSMRSSAEVPTSNNVIARTGKEILRDILPLLINLKSLTKNSALCDTMKTKVMFILLTSNH